jgi:hypothetical protein
MIQHLLKKKKKIKIPFLFCSFILYIIGTSKSDPRMNGSDMSQDFLTRHKSDRVQIGPTCLIVFFYLLYD